MKQLLRWFKSLVSPKTENALYTEKAEQFAGWVLGRYETGIRQISPQKMIHISFRPAETQKYQKKETDDWQDKILRRLMREAARIDKLEKRIGNTDGMERRILQTMRSHTEREIRRVREENAVHVKYFRTSLRQESESRKKVQETIREDFLRETKVLGRIQEEIRYHTKYLEESEVVLVYPAAGEVFAADRSPAKRRAVVSGLPEIDRGKHSLPILIGTEKDAGRRRLVPEETVRRIVRENIKEEADWLAGEIYRKLERQLIKEKKRRGF